MTKKLEDKLMPLGELILLLQIDKGFRPQKKKKKNSQVRLCWNVYRARIEVEADILEV